MLLLLFACTPDAQSMIEIEVVQVYASPAARPWLTELYACAGEHAVGLDFDPQDAEISIQMGESQNLTLPAYKIGEEELLVAVNEENPIQIAAFEKLQGLFEGRGDHSVQIWVYSPETDLQQAFDSMVMRGRRISSNAKVASGPDQVFTELNMDVGAIGILPRHWIRGTVRDLYSVGFMPVLAVTREEPTGAGQTLLECLQE